MGLDSILHTPLPELKVFYCYAREDQILREKLDLYLAHLKRLYHFSTWFDRLILPGEKWEWAIEENLNGADIVLLLISPDFMASNYCYNIEMQRALERHARGETHIIPILLRPTYWEDAPFSRFQMLPANGVPLTRWPDADEAFQDIVVGLNKLLLQILGKPASVEEIPEKQSQAREEYKQQKPQQFSAGKQKPDITVSGNIQGAIVNIGGQTSVQGNMTIDLQDMQQSSDS